MATLSILFAPTADAQVSAIPLPGEYVTSWIGNSFGGSGALANEGLFALGNGYGSWVQDGISSIVVSPDGTVFSAVDWDEAGRGVALYKDGQVNRVPVTAVASSFKTYDFNTASTAICVDGNEFYIASVAKGLLRFKWTPGNINSSSFVSDVALPEKAVGLSCNNGKILIGYPDGIESRSERDMSVLARLPEHNLSGVALADDGSFWIIISNVVHHLLANGIDTGATLIGVERPSSLTWSAPDTLVVTDDGHAQQVLFFDVSGPPRLIRRFGQYGGIESGYPGAYAPDKLFGLRGSGMDSKGNIYVGMSFAPGSGGNAFIRAYSPTGSLAWQLFSASFIDTFNFLPGSDGTIVFGPTTLWKLNLGKLTQAPGTESTLTAFTIDPERYPNDPRRTQPASVYPVKIAGLQFLYTLGQVGGPFTIYGSTPNSYILHQIPEYPPKGGWAWSVTEDGDIWWGDDGDRIAYYPLRSVENDVPAYDWQRPKTWPRPPDFSRIMRVSYVKATDSLYIFGYLKGQTAPSWGLLGLTARRYDGWLTGTPRLVWTNSNLPTQNLWVDHAWKSLPPKEASVAGTYIFMGMAGCGEIHNRPEVNIIDAEKGSYVGNLLADDTVGRAGGQEDMSGSIHAVRRSNGEYLVLVEDDYRAKNILFRWLPGVSRTAKRH